MDRRRVLLIAGSDSSGGAGLEADQKVVSAHACYAMTATTALTAQNTQGVIGIHETPAEFVRKQIDACIDDIGVDVVKTGMLASAETVDVVADALRRHGSPLSVIDPVMVSTTGAQLLSKDAVRSLRERMLPLATVLTPNVPEANLLLRNAGHEISDPQTFDDIVDVAKALHRLGPKYVLLKGGHLPLTKDRKISSRDADKHTVIDILYDGTTTTLIESDYFHSKNTHGTGCSLASAIACNLALGQDVPQAVRSACQYVEAGIKTSVALGKGSGPINHFHSTYTLPFSPGHFLGYLLNRSDVKDTWRAHTEHEFVQRIADGTLPVEKFKYYLIQDYLFLVQFARAKALAAYKANSIDSIAATANEILHIQREMTLHLTYCREDFNLSKPDIEAHEEHQACTAYTRLILDIGHTYDAFALNLAFAPCLLGYGEIAARLAADATTVREGNRYWKWVANYVAEDYTQAVGWEDWLEKHAVGLSLGRIEELVRIFVQATKMETGFWDMGCG
ncbi:MAG: thiamine biosynthesis (Thi-4) [Lasallia pustulata]|uniref:Thiamine biosynthesis (Thi-4) n=1 Tax=Lasallia pustulata TaxID=136370 RepID=A0A5M8PTG6_9LECA|nr:MAG: thiamine biosynthesis (Thi-4) [Lasallia pustulata]